MKKTVKLGLIVILIVLAIIVLKSLCVGFLNMESSKWIVILAILFLKELVNITMRIIIIVVNVLFILLIIGIILV